MSLTIEKFNVKLQKEDILHDVSLDIKDGEFISLLGASGCGKTTLLKSIAGLLETESGAVYINGENISRKAPEHRGTVIVFQDLRLFPHMTVEKNIRFAMELKKVPRIEQRETVRKLLEDVQLAGYESRKIKEMSGGQMQRVALARALAAKPEVLLLDEPFSGLDEKLRTEMGALVKELHRKRSLTTVLVTHDKREALQMSDRIALMSDGDILQYDSPKDIFYRPVTKEVADYFGKANYIRGTVRDGVFSCKIFESKADAADGIYDALIRPFDIQIEPNGEGCVVQEAVFKGETAELLLETPQGGVVSSVSGRELEHLGISAGSRVGITVNPSGAVCYYEEE